MRVITTMALLAVITVATAQTKEQVAKELVRQGIPHANIVLAQARLETGNFKSRRCRQDHNLFGIKHGKRYATYRRWQDSVIDYKERVSSRYKGGDYYIYLQKINYASDRRYIHKLRQFK